MDAQQRVSWRWATLIPLVLLQIWVAHAVVFFAHEYAHTVVAWLLGWKKNPLDLNYPKPSITVFLIQLGIDQKVDEVPILAAGRGVDAGLIAAAGMVLGNGLITFPLSRFAYAKGKAAGRPAWAMLAFWVTAASIGNFLDYVPIRVFSGDSDMGSVEHGLGLSPWVIMVLLGLPTLLATSWFVVRIVPETVSWLFPRAPSARYGVALLSIFGVFGFYGAVGLLEGGPIALTLSRICVFVVMPTAMFVEVLLLRRRRPSEAD